MEVIQHFAMQSMKKNAPELRPGDTVRVHQRIREGNKERVQVYEGVVIAVRGGKSISSSFVVRRVSYGIGVEKVFPLHSPNVLKVERVKSAPVRQARLYYLRERFGRAARLRGEVYENTVWDESAVAEEPTTDAVEETEAPAEEVVEVAEEAPIAEETVTEAEPVAVTDETPAEETEVKAEKATESAEATE